MDISAIDSSYSAKLSTELNTEQSKVESFQTVLESAVANNDKAELKKACVDFEGYFVQMMFRAMRKTVVSDGGIFPKGHAEEVFQDMLDEEYSKSAADVGGIGIADMMYKQLSKTM